MAPQLARQQNRTPPSYSSMLKALVQAITNKREAGISLYLFLIGFSVCLFLNSSSFFFSCLTVTLHATLLFIVLYELDTLKSYLPVVEQFNNFLEKCFGLITESNQAVAKRAYLLGVLVGTGKFLFHYSSTWNNFGVWIAVLGFFHWSEYFFTAISNPANLGIKSFLLDHSKEYHAAACIALLEFLIERWLFPSVKISASPQLSFFNWLGFFLCIGGETFRKLAMITCGTNFNHLIEYANRKNHVLVKHGVYGIVRHPSYTGWFVWSIGTQLILGNPVSVLLYGAASWMFFKERIPDEEDTLIEKFGQEYLDYKETVPLGLPLIQT